MVRHPYLVFVSNLPFLICSKGRRSTIPRSPCRRRSCICCCPICKRPRWRRVKRRHIVVLVILHLYLFHTVYIFLDDSCQRLTPVQKHIRRRVLSSSINRSQLLLREHRHLVIIKLVPILIILGPLRASMKNTLLHESDVMPCISFRPLVRHDRCDTTNSARHAYPSKEEK